MRSPASVTRDLTGSADLLELFDPHHINEVVAPQQRLYWDLGFLAEGSR